MSGTDKMQNNADELKGKAKEAVGDATGNEQWQAEGRADQAKGKGKQAGESSKTLPRASLANSSSNLDALKYD